MISKISEQPVISVDTKKKELVGNFKNNGKEYRPKGDPVEVNVYDFKDKELDDYHHRPDNASVLRPWAARLNSGNAPSVRSTAWPYLSWRSPAPDARPSSRRETR